MFTPREIALRAEQALARQGKLGQTLIKAALGSAGMKLAFTAIGFINAMLLARMLTPSGYGIYSYVMALVTLLAIPAELGIPGLATREVAVTNARQEWGYMRGFIIRSHQAVLAFAAVLIVLAAVALSFWGRGMESTKLQAMWLGLLLVPLVSLGALRSSMLRGLRKVLLAQLPHQIIRPLIFMLLILSLPFWRGDLVSPGGVMGMQVISATVAFCVGLYFFFRNRPAELMTARPVYRTSLWIKTSIPFGLIAGMQEINGQTDILVLGLFHSDSDVGLYRVATQMAAFVVFGLYVVNMVQGPHIAHLFACKDMPRLQRMVTKSARAILAFTLPVVLVLVLFGKMIITAAFGAEFAAAYPALVVLCLGQLVNASFGSVGSLLNMTGYEKDTFQGIAIGAFVNVALNFALTPVWGIMGAAVATAVTLVVWNLVMWRKVRLRLGIEPSAFSRVRG